MYELIILVVIGTSIWVAFDAPAHDLSRTWALGCAALWILAFPWYLAERSRRPVRTASAPAATSGRWEPDPRNPREMERWREGTRWTKAVRRREES